MTEDQIASIQYAADWLSRSEDIGNRKHGERLRALLSASIADTADNAQCDTGKCGIGGYCKECPSIADTAGARPDPKARMEYAEGILRATPKLLPTFAIEDLLKRCEDSDDREDVWEAIQAQADIRAREAIFAQLERGRVAAPPAPSVADAAGASDLDSKRLDWLEQEDEMGCFHNIDHITANINEGFNGFKTLREAIDDAIAKDSGK